MKSKNVYPKDVPIIMLGGSPHIVAEPPKLAQKISAKIIGAGSNLSILASSIVTAAKNRITVMLSINIAKIADINIKAIKMGMVLYLTAFASLKQSQRKKPDLAIPSTIIIIPKTKIMVDQFMPVVASPASPASYQKDSVKILLMFIVCQKAVILRIQTPKTATIVKNPQAKAITCLSSFSDKINKNIAKKIIIAAACAISTSPLFMISVLIIFQ